MFIDCVLMNGRGANDHAMHFDLGANVLHLFSVGGHKSSSVNCLGGRCPHMPFFIGGHMSGGGKCPTLAV